MYLLLSFSGLLCYTVSGRRVTAAETDRKEQNVVCPDLLIAVDVSGLETREQKADVEKAFETCGWIYDGGLTV